MWSRTRDLRSKHRGFLTSIWLFGLVMILLVTSTAYMLFRLYSTSTMLTEANRNSFLQQGREKAAVVNEYLELMNQRVEALANSRALQSYYHNKYLGMSMEYGLAVALAEVAGELNRFQINAQDHGRQVFSQVIFFDLQEARIIAQVHSNGLARIDEKLIKEILGTQKKNTGFVTLCDGNSCRTFILLSVTYKGESKGYLVLELALDRIHERIQLRSLQRANDFCGLADTSGTLILGPKQLIGRKLSELFGVALTIPETFQIIEIADSKSVPDKECPVIAGARISTTGFSLVVVDPETSCLLGYPPSLWPILFITLATGFLLMLGYVFVSFIDRFKMYRELVEAHGNLEVRIEHRTAALAETNRALRHEICRREMVEEALQRARDELEIRVEHRTAELLTANELLQKEASERKQAEETSRESEKRFRELAELLPVFVYEFDEHGIFTFVNRAGLELGGYTAKDLAEQLTVASVIHPNHRKKAGRNLARVLAGERLSREEYTLLKKDGSTAPIETWSIPISGDHKIVGVRGVGVDITERKIVEDRMKASLREKEVLLREIHHRVKNNLAVIISLLGLRSHYLTDPATEEAFREIQDRIHSMATAHEMLYQSENLAAVSVKQYVGRLLDHHAASMDSVGKAIEIHKEIEDFSFGLDTAIPLGLLVTELVSNCLKHAFPGGREGEIRVSLTSGDQECFELLLADNGIGMPQEVDPKNPDSFGLGLVRIFVAQLHGRMEFAREDGTEVRIVFKEVKKSRRANLK